MTTLPITPEGAERIEAAHDRYVAALRAFNSLRCAKLKRSGEPDYVERWKDAHRRVEETFAEWVMLLEHETGRKLKFGLR
jgi:hypothetical protein